MSSLVVVNATETEILNYWISLLESLNGGLDLRLYRNNVTTGLTPDQIDALAVGSFTEANFAGYAAVSLDGAWTYTQGNPSTAVNTKRSFTRSSTGTAQSIFGYYVTRGTGGSLAYFEQFDGPIVVEFINDRIDVTPRMTLDDPGGIVVEPGTITATGRTTAPTGWLLCQGQAVSRSTFAALFAAIGITYGAGDGSTTFNVPNLQQRFPLGKATSGTGATLGGTGGAVDHTHPLDSSTSHARIATSTGAFSPFVELKTVSSWTTTHVGSAVVPASATGGQTLGTRLAGSSDIANPPFQVVNYQIKT